MADRNGVILALRELADKKRQARLWLSPEGPEVSSFAEAVCQLYDDTGLGSDLDKGLLVFGVDIDKQLLTLRRALRSIDRALPDEVLLESHEMESIRSAAAAILANVDG